MKGARIWPRVLLPAAVLSLALAACEDEPDVADAPPDDEQFLDIGTAGTGGTYYAYGGGFASVLNEHVDAVEGNAESTGGSVENVRLVHGGESDLGIVQADVVWEATHGEGEFEDDPQDIQVVGGTYPNYMQLATLDEAGIETVDDLAGASVSVGPAGGGQEVTLRTAMDALGMSFDDFGAVENLGFGDQNMAFGDGQIEVGNYMTSLYAGTLEELAATQDIGFVAFSEDEVSQVVDTAPYFFQGTIPGGMYDGVDDDVEYVPALWNWLIVHEDADDDLVYDLTDALYDHGDQLEGTTPVAEETVPENLEEVTTPLHPGALEWAEEQGIDLPEEAYAD